MPHEALNHLLPEWPAMQHASSISMPFTPYACMQVPFWCQRASLRDGPPEADEQGDPRTEAVVWDYHVFVIQAGSSSSCANSSSSSGNAAPTPHAQASAEGSAAAGAPPNADPPPAAATAAAGGGSLAAAAAMAWRQQPQQHAASPPATASQPADDAKPALVWDLDSLLEFPCTLHKYARKGLQTGLPLRERYQRCARGPYGVRLATITAAVSGRRLLQSRDWQRTY